MLPRPESSPSRDAGCPSAPKPRKGKNYSPSASPRGRPASCTPKSTSPTHRPKAKGRPQLLQSASSAEEDYIHRPTHQQSGGGRGISALDCPVHLSPVHLRIGIAGAAHPCPAGAV